MSSSTRFSRPDVVKGDGPAFLAGATPTADRRLAAYRPRLERALAPPDPRADAPPPPTRTEIPGLDLARLGRKYGPQNAGRPRALRGTFAVPLDVSARQYAAFRDAAVRRFVESLDKQGWQFRPEYRIQVTPGLYPARDLRDGTPRLDQREVVVTAHFAFRDPKPLRLELPPDVVAPLAVRGQRVQRISAAPGAGATAR